MSLQEVIDLARTLPRTDQLQLVAALNPAPGEPSEDLLKLIPPGFTAEFWHADLTPESGKVIDEFLESMKGESK